MEIISYKSIGFGVVKSITNYQDLDYVSLQRKYFLK